MQLEGRWSLLGGWSGGWVSESSLSFPVSTSLIPANFCVSYVLTLSFHFVLFSWVGLLNPCLLFLSCLCPSLSPSSHICLFVSTLLPLSLGTHASSVLLTLQ